MSKNTITEQKVAEALKNLGVPASILGYRYLKEAILIVSKRETIVQATKELYPSLAKQYETTATRVERCIRFAVEESFSRSRSEHLEKVFGRTVKVGKGKLTNMEYIYGVAEYLKMKEI